MLNSRTRPRRLRRPEQRLLPAEPVPGVPGLPPHGGGPRAHGGVRGLLAGGAAGGSVVGALPPGDQGEVARGCGQGVEGQDHILGERK